MKKEETGLNLRFGVVCSLYWILWAASTVFLVPILRQKGMADGQIGFLFSVRSLAAICFSPVIASFLDRHVKIQIKYVLMLLAGLNILNVLFFQYTRPNFWQMVLIFVVLGGTTNTMLPLHSSLAMKFQKPGRTIQFNLGRGAGSVAYAVAALALGKMVGETNLNLAFTFQIVMDILTMLVLVRFPDYEAENASQTEKRQEEAHSNFYIIRKYPWFFLFLIASAFAYVGYNMCSSFLVDIIVDRGGNNADLGIASFILGMSELPAALFYRKLEKKFGICNLVMMSAVFGVIKMLAMYLSPNVFCICLAQTLQILGNGLYWQASVYYVKAVIPGADQVKGQSLTTVFSVNIGAILGSICSGQMLQYFDVNGLLLFGTLCCGVGVVIMGVSMRQSKKHLLAIDA